MKGIPKSASEEWRPVVGWEGLYEVSDQGRVRSLDRPPMNGRRANKGRTLKAVPNGAKGYPHVILTDGRQRRGYHVHVLVARAFIGPRPPRQDVCHRNSVNTDNRLSNLRYGTRTSNAMDRVEAGHDHNASRGACRRGHPYSEENTKYLQGVTKDGVLRVWRVCRTCHKQSRQKGKAAA